jgi:hypothetical protein
MHALLAACNPVLIDPGEGCEGDGRLADIDTPDDLLDIGRQIRETGLD